MTDTGILIGMVIASAGLVLIDGILITWIGQRIMKQNRDIHDLLIKLGAALNSGDEKGT
jgi:hypothetical protein